jgi:hypothetical protein
MLFFYRTDPEEDIKSTLTVCRFDEKDNERGADRKWGSLQVCS